MRNLKMKLELFVLSIVFGLNAGSDIIGVPPSKLLLYQPNKDFTCFDGSLSIPFNAVNDDFCDCIDGSDEPGTSACASSIFYCLNTGYYPLNVPSSRVNDGICDCCDGSDEYLLKNCTDTCEILGAEALAEAERIAELMNKGNTMRVQMSASGKQLRQEKQEKLMELTKELTEAEKIKSDAEQLKTEAETKENAALEVYRAIEEKAKQEAAVKEKQQQDEEAKGIFMEMDTDGNSILTPLELLNKLKMLKSSEVKTDSSLEEQVNFIMNSKTEMTFEEFLSSTWNHLRSLLALEDTMTPLPPIQKEENNGDHHHDHDHDHHDDDHTEGAEEEEDGEEDRHDEGEEHEEDDKEFEGEVEEQHYGPKPPLDSNIEYDEETKKLMDEANKARQHLDDADRAVKDIERDITSLKEFLDKDFGPEDEFLTLEGQCFSYSDREYTYKLCPFDQVVQSGKHGGSETRLGTWKGWENQGQYNTMLYDRGQSCWNGPQRSAKVHLSCGLENEVIGAAEPNKCEYVLDFKTPAACHPTSKHDNRAPRDEL